MKASFPAWSFGSPSHGFSLEKHKRPSGTDLPYFEEALRLRPDLAEPASRLARFLATCSEMRFRDGARAVALAERAAELTQYRSARVLDTLAAAYAAAGRFAEAVTSAHRAQQRASLDGQGPLAGEIEARLALYARGEAFVEGTAAGEAVAAP